MDSRITTIAEALHELQATGKYTVFYDYSGHINAIGVRIFKGERLPGKEPLVNRLFRLDRPDLQDILYMNNTTVEEFIALIGRYADGATEDQS
jgi:hypothetical protein